MYEVNEKDWKLLRKRVPGWQENYMAKLNKEYIEILSKDRNPSTNFWELEDRIFHDKKHIGVVIDMRRSRMVENICRLVLDGVIEFKDLEGFSEELLERVKFILRIDE